MDCFNHSCPFRVNETSNANRCECIACQNRSNSDFIITSNRTLTNDELAMLTALRSGDKNYGVGNQCQEVLTVTEYIEREAGIKAIENDLPEQVHYSREDAADCIRYMPAADVAPVRHGQWSNGDPYCPVCRKDKFRGLDADIWADWQPDYCPNCGAKMDLEVTNDV